MAAQQQANFAEEEKPKEKAARKPKEPAGAPVAGPTPTVAPAQPAAAQPTVQEKALAKPEPAAVVVREPEPRNAMERIIRDRMRVAQFLDIPVQMIALIEDKSHRGPPEVYVRSKGLLFMGVRKNGGKAPGYKTDFIRQNDEDPENPDFVSKTTLMPTPDPTTWVEGYGTANKRTLAKHMLPFAREMCETRSRVRALQAFTGCGFSVLLPEDQEDSGGHLREVKSESIVTAAEVVEEGKRDRSFYADDGPPSAAAPLPRTASKEALDELQRWLAKTGKVGLDVLDAHLRKSMVEGAAELEPGAFEDVLDELKALAAMKG